jgi:hypothetical protein
MLDIDKLISEMTTKKAGHGISKNRTKKPYGMCPQCGGYSEEAEMVQDGFDGMVEWNKCGEGHEWNELFEVKYTGWEETSV